MRGSQLNSMPGYSDQDGSFIDKVRVERADGTVGSHSLPVEGTLQLIAGWGRIYGQLARTAGMDYCFG